MADHLTTVVLVSVIFMMLGVGLNTAYREVLEVARNVRLVGRGLIVNFVLVPALIWACLSFLPLSTEVQIGILLMAAAPIAPMAPPFVGMAKGDLPYSVGLMTIVAVLSIALTPIILSLTLPGTEGELELSAWSIVQILLTAQLIPIGVGMAVHQVSPAWTKRLLAFVPRLGQLGLFIGIGLLLASQFGEILAIGVLGHLVNVALVVACLALGELALFRDPAPQRRSLAISTAIRNIPLAFLIANANFAGTAVAPVTLVFATYSMIAAVVYGKMLPAIPVQSGMAESME
jgi:BASS family bile acid:Na+ symporter